MTWLFSFVVYCRSEQALGHASAFSTRERRFKTHTVEKTTSPQVAPLAGIRYCSNATTNRHWASELRYKRFEGSSLNYRVGRCIFILAFFVLGTAGTPALAQDAVKPPAAKWRPKDGTYAALGANFAMRCGEFGDLIVELAEKSIGSDESSCNVVKLADTAPGTIRLDLSCTNSDHPKPQKLITLLRRIDEKTIVYGENNGKDRAIRYAYCPEEPQQLYRDSRDKAQAEQKAAEERAKQKQ